MDGIFKLEREHGHVGLALLDENRKVETVVVQDKPQRITVKFRDGSFEILLDNSHFPPLDKRIWRALQSNLQIMIGHYDVGDIPLHIALQGEDRDAYWVAIERSLIA